MSRKKKNNGLYRVEDYLGVGGKPWQVHNDSDITLSIVFHLQHFFYVIIFNLKNSTHTHKKMYYFLDLPY